MDYAAPTRLPAGRVTCGQPRAGQFTRSSGALSCADNHLIRSALLLAAAASLPVVWVAAPHASRGFRARREDERRPLLIADDSGYEARSFQGRDASFDVLVGDQASGLPRAG